MAGKRGVAGCRVDGLPQEFLESSHGVWLKTLAYLVLSRRERAVWDSMQATAKERCDWLLSRCAAKDAVRMLIQESRGVQLCAADGEINPRCLRPAGGGLAGSLRYVAWIELGGRHQLGRQVEVNNSHIPLR